jgi:hypothetical protein
VCTPEDEVGGSLQSSGEEREHHSLLKKEGLGLPGSMGCGISKITALLTRF